MTKQRDSIYATPLTQVSDFAFDAQVASVFPDMINRSVPGYATIVNTIGRLANRYAQENTRIYDLGCSLGAVSLSIKQQCSVSGVHITALDSSAAMVERCQSHVNAYRGAIPIDVQVADILDYNFQACSLIVLNFTLQFIDREQRNELLHKLYNALLPGGMLVLSEKITHQDPVADELLIDLHHEFKRENGYSDLEISQKRAALEHVMRLDTPEEHEARLRAAGFTTVQAWFRCFNFTSWIAIKGTTNELE
ncbi:carboxy-S-adenosyl-L-methionine synthase CmoA [Aliidiomarina indica]|uniref:carboxy-S-adenosyl-L-methionine synthase CmoA n=1 Tax=Aliidiomarina indica TaxID=2749147 RepID=UPI00188FABC1|nr:carboxy-S-adenosyl-L-methionine synthase CmoA [Aliidiomarina indica]